MTSSPQIKHEDLIELIQIGELLVAGHVLRLIPQPFHRVERWAIGRQKSSARSQLKPAIEDVLDTGLPRAYDKPLYERKCSALFEHIYESYPERDAGVYAEAG